MGYDIPTAVFSVITTAAVADITTSFSDITTAGLRNTNSGILSVITTATADDKNKNSIHFYTI